MLLKTLTLRNYRKYKNACIEFPDGVIGIIGLNGVGKTTLVEAIGWAIFGHYAARTTKELIKRRGASPHEPCQVELEFELGGDHYKVMREMAGKNLAPKAKLVINGEVITSNAEEVTAVLERKMGMDYQSFFTSVFARQKELNALSAMKAAERKKLMLRMLGIERIENSIQALREDRRGKEKKIEGIKAAIVDKEGRKKIDLLRAKMAELDRDKESLIQLIKEIELEKEEKERAVMATKRELELATGKYERYVELTNMLGERRSYLEDVRRSREASEKELAELITKQKRLQAIQAEENRYFEYKARKNELELLRSRYQQKIELTRRQEKTVQEINQRAALIKELEAKIAEFRGVEDLFDARMRLKDEMEQLRDRYRQKEELMRRKERAMREIKGREAKIGRLKDDRRVFEDADAQLEAVKGKIEELRRDKERLHSEIGGYKTRTIQIKRDIKASREKIEQIKRLGPGGECPLCERQLGTHYEFLIKKLDEELRAREEELSTAFKDYKKKKQELDSKGELEESLTKQLQGLEKRVNKRRELDTKIEQENRELDSWREELDAISAALKPLEGVEFDDSRYKAVIAEINELEKRVRAKRELEVRMAHEGRELRRWREELEHIRSDLESVADVVFNENEYNSVTSELKELERVYHEIIGLRAEIKRMGAVKTGIQELRDEERKIVGEIAALQKQVEELAFDKMAYVELKARYERESEGLSEVKLKLMGKKHEFESVCREIERVRADIEEQERLIRDKEREEEDIMYLNLLEKIMNDFKLYMVGMIRPLLADYASDMLRRLTDGKYSRLELDENYDVFIYEDGTAYELNRFSGGEEDLANLCLRLAISAVVAERSAIQTNFIILDEIFGSQDVLRKRNIVTALRELSRKFRQILLITHIEDVKDYMEYVLKVSEDVDGVSMVRLEG